jgi:hypothetical protein
MAEIVVQGQKFKIKGDTATPREQLAIETYLSGKKQKRAFDFDTEMELMIRPEDILTDAEKGKYNQDTESFLKSPGFMRIVTEVGLSIAGGIAGAALAPVTGGGSLVAAAGLAARTARLVRPLLNISANTMSKIGAATAGAGAGGAIGAGISQTFDPRESIVREVARGAAQGAFGEVLGFGVAGGLAKAYNKITKGTIDTIAGAERATQIISRDKEFFKALKQFDEGKPITEEVITSLRKGKQGKDGETIVEGITPEQEAILRSPKRSEETVEMLKNRESTFFKDIEKANITPGFITQNNAVNFMSNVARSSIFLSGSVRTAEQSGKMATLNGIDAFVDSTLKGFPRLDGIQVDDTGYAVGQLIQDSITKNKALYEETKNKMWNALTDEINRVAKRPDGTFDPAFDVIIKGEGVPKTLSVLRKQGDGFVDETVEGLDDYVKTALKENADVNDPDVSRMLGMVMALGDRADFQRFRRVYTAIGEMRPSGIANTVKAELVKRMEAMMADSPLPGPINNMRKSAAQFTNFGAKFFRDATLKKIMNTQKGQETIYKQIVASGKESYYDEFFKVLDESKTTINGTKYDVFPNKETIKDAVRGQFFKDFLENSRDLTGQYPTLTRGKATKFLNNHSFLVDKPGFLTLNQSKAIKDYTKAINIVEGKIKAAGEAGSNPVMFMQLNQAGAISQGLGLFLGASGNIDPGTAAFFVLGPAGLAKAFSSPRVTQLLINGLGGKGLTIDSTQKLTRYFGQLSSALVSEGLMPSEDATAMMNEIEGNKSQYDKFFKTGILEGAQGEVKPNPEAAPPIEVDLGQRQSNLMNTAVPLPEVTPSNFPVSSAPQQQPSRTELAQTLNLFNKGGIASVRRK